jgi:hypothetical protein
MYVMDTTCDAFRIDDDRQIQWFFAVLDKQVGFFSRKPAPSGDGDDNLLRSTSRRHPNQFNLTEAFTFNQNVQFHNRTPLS